MSFIELSQAIRLFEKNNVQSLHGTPYDFRRNILMHKTTEHKWEQMKSSRGSRKLEAQGRDIHLVPVEFLYHDPEMLRDYGERILLTIQKQKKLFPLLENQKTDTFWFPNILTSTIWKQFTIWTSLVGIFRTLLFPRPVVTICMASTRPNNCAVF